MKKVITYGTFDVFHYGHLYLLQNAASYGHHLTVCVSTDQFNQSKGKVSKLSFEERCQIVKQISCVNEVMAENTWEQKIADIERLNIDVFAIGDDWKGHFDFLSEFCEVIYLPRTPLVSSTVIRETIDAH